MEELLLEPVSYYKTQKGKDTRKVLSNLFGKLLGVNDENIELINRITNDLHNASLVIDDIEDNSLLRRNKPCAHIKYGIPLSINAGYYSFFKSSIIIFFKIDGLFFHSFGDSGANESVNSCSTLPNSRVCFNQHDSLLHTLLK